MAKIGPREQALRDLRESRAAEKPKKTTTPPASAPETMTEPTAQPKPALKETAAMTKDKTAKPTRVKKVKAPKKASTKVKAPAKPATKTAGQKTIRKGSKLAICAQLLLRPEGCTAAEVLAATKWPAVSMPQQARAAGLKLKKEKDGKVTRYWGTPAASAA